VAKSLLYIRRGLRATCLVQCGGCKNTKQESEQNYSICICSYRWSQEGGADAARCQCSSDHEKDVIVEAPISFDVRSFLKSNMQLEGCVEKYLAAFEKHQDYMEKVLGDSFDPGIWSGSRRHLAARLLRDVETLRGTSKEERDWDMNVEES